MADKVMTTAMIRKERDKLREGFPMRDIWTALVSISERVDQLVEASRGRSYSEDV